MISTHLGGDQVDLREAGGNLEIEVTGNGGNVTTIVGVQAEDLSRASLVADPHNAILDDASLLITQLTALGFDPFA